MNLISITIILIQIIQHTQTQSTCPVITNSQTNDMNHQQQRCKCGIKTDGQIYIYCARKQLKRLPKFTKSSILYEELILSGNQIEKININSFNGLRVKRLYLDDNPLSLIESNSLNELANYLEELVISSQQIRQAVVPFSIFQNLLNLKIVKLTGLVIGSEQVSNLKQSMFNRTRKLEMIHLVDCGLQRVEFNSLSGLEFSLKELNLDNNQLSSTLDIFSEIKRMKRLQTLILSRNKIRILAKFTTSETISSDNHDSNDFFLDLSFNAINQIDELAFGSSYNQPRSLSNLITKLNLNNNELNQFQLNFVSQLVNLKELSLDYNKIESIPENLFTNSRFLESISFKGNSIISIQSEFSFSGLHFNLKRLNLASNKMQSLGKRVFMQTTKLKELNLERNNLGVHFDSIVSNTSDLMSTFEGIESELKMLNLENNQLKPEHLWSLANLLNIETLKLGHNKMSSLNLKATNQIEKQELTQEKKLFKLFEFYRNLSSLDMQNSSLNQMPYFISLNKSLTSFNVAQNQICNINSNNLKSIYNKLKNFNLNSNPLKCDCNLIGLREWIDTNDQLSTEQAFNWKCQSPTINKNKYLNQLNLNYDFNCDQSDEQDQCVLDEDEIMFRKTTTSTTIVTSTTSTTTTTTVKSTSTILPILIFATSSHTQTKLVTIQEDAELKLEPMSQNQQINPILAPVEQQTTTSASFFSSAELKQTLLGSFIGALSVILIVFFIIVIIKVTHNRFKGKDISICNTTTNESDKDKSNRTTSTSPYDLTKLSLCINNCGNNSSASSSSSTSSCTSSLGVTNSSCICGILKTAGLEMNHDTKECLFNKMDPLRLTMLSSASNLINNNNGNLANSLANSLQNRSSFYQHYLNCNNQVPNQMYNCNNNIHYIASHLPYSSPTESLISGSCPSPYQLNNEQNEFSNDNNKQEKLFSFLSGKAYSNTSNSNLISSHNTTNNNISLLNGTTESNTYDKLHHRLNTSLSFVKPSNSSFNNTNTLGYSANQCVHNLNQFNLNELICNNRTILNGESAPFLILSNSDVNRLIDLNTINENATMNNLVNNNYDLANNQANFNMQRNQASNECYQHTYHEIGDVLINNGSKSVNKSTANNVRNVNSEVKSEMFI